MGKIARVQMPDGRIARFEVADGTPQADIEAAAGQINSDEAPDLTNQFNTALSSPQESQFEAWQQKLPARLRSARDYDLRGAWKAGAQEAANGHLTDEFKKPNHPTFSSESIYSGKNGEQGGQWSKDKADKWIFKPGASNLKNYGQQGLEDYFKRSEPDSILDMGKPPAELASLYDLMNHPPGPPDHSQDSLLTKIDNQLQSPSNLPIALSTLGSLAFPPIGAGGLLTSVLASGVGGGAGSALNESMNPDATGSSIAGSALKGAATMGASELAGFGVGKAASKLIAPGVKLPVITPMRDKLVELGKQLPQAAKDVSAQVIDALPHNAQAGATKAFNAMGTAATKVGNFVSSPFIKEAAMPLAAAVAGPVVSVPLTVLKELLSPGFISRYLARKPLSQGTDEALRQLVTSPMRGELAP